MRLDVAYTIKVLEDEYRDFLDKNRHLAKDLRPEREVLAETVKRHFGDIL